MKIVLLSALSSIHTVRWANVFAQRGHEVHAVSVSVHKNAEPLDDRVRTHFLPFGDGAGYYINAPILKKLLREIKPDVLNAHYASGYGTLARLCGFRPYVLSVWGSDVYDFPYESRLKMKIIQKNLASADAVCSTSEVMKRQTERLLTRGKEIFVTPFGIDLAEFSPKKEYGDAVKVIGTVKTLAPKYGISVLLKSFASLLKDGAPPDLTLVIAGDGPQKQELVGLARELGIYERVSFVGKVPHAKVPELLRTFDVYVALSESESESFGVAILEASACGVPVVVSNAGGLPEVAEDGVTGLVVPKGDPEAAKEAIKALVKDPALAGRLGENGVKRARERYSWDSCSRLLERVLENTAAKTACSRGASQ